mgnify:CR=1 FL=1
MGLFFRSNVKICLRYRRAAPSPSLAKHCPPTSLGQKILKLKLPPAATTTYCDRWDRSNSSKKNPAVPPGILGFRFSARPQKSIRHCHALPRFHRPRLSERTESKLTYSSSTVLCIVAPPHARVKGYGELFLCIFMHFYCLYIHV